MYKEELTNKDVPLRVKMKLFNTIVTPTVLYGCSSWVLTVARQKKLQTSQMRMMRSILGRKRTVEDETGDKENWVSWVKRTTAEAREKMKSYSVEDWVEIVSSRQRKWKARMEALDPKKWAYQALEWQPVGFRSIVRPARRWVEENLKAD